VHPANELRTEADDFLKGAAEPSFGEVENLRVPVDRRDQRADVDLRV